MTFLTRGNHVSYNQTCFNKLYIICLILSSSLTGFIHLGTYIKKNLPSLFANYFIKFFLFKLVRWQKYLNVCFGLGESNFLWSKKKTITPSKGKQKEKNQNRTKDYYNNKKQQLQQKVSCSWREHFTEPKLQVVTVIN